MAEEIRADLLLGRDSLTPGLLKAGRAAKDASGDVGSLTRQLYELNRARATPVVDLNDKAAVAHLDEVKAKLDELGKKVAAPKIDPQDKAALASVASMRLQLDRLGRMVATPRVTLEGVDRAQAQLLRLDTQLSRMTQRRGLFSRAAGGLLGLFGGGGGLSLASGAAGAGGATAQGGGGLLAALGPAGAGVGIGLGALLGALLAPGAIPLGLGTLIGGGAAFGGVALGQSAQTQLRALQTALKGATGKQREQIRDQIAAFRQANAGPLGVAGAFHGLTGTLTAVFSGALTRPGPAAIGPSGRPIPGTGAPSFLTSLTGIFRQIAAFIKSIGPSLGDIFRASVPYIRTFVGFLEQATKILLPVFTHLLQEFQPLLPTISKGLIALVQGLAGFLKALGPQGMKTSAQAFVLLAKATAGLLIILGKVIDFYAAHIPVVAHNTAAWFDRIRHWMAALGDWIMQHWDQWRHGWAHIWDVIFQDTIGKMIRFGHNVEAAFNSVSKFVQAWALRVEILFAGWAKNVVHIAADAFGWVPGIGPKLKAADQKIGAFVASTQAKLHALTHKSYPIDFRVTLPPGASPNLRGPGGQVPGHAAGTPAAAPGWAVVGEKGPELVSMRGGEVVIPNHALRGYAAGTPGVTVHLSTPSIREMAATLGGFVGRIVRAVQSQYTVPIAGGSTPPGFGIAPNGPLQQYARYLLRAYGWGSQWAAFNDVVMRESGWNVYAQNPTSGAYGIPQALPGSKMASAGADWRTDGFTQLRWMMAYIASRYGSPAGAWNSELTRGWYDHGGYLQPGWNLAYNGTGRPELVTPARGTRGAGGTTVYLTVQVGHGTHPVAAAQEIVKLLNVGARNGVRLRSSILGPG